MSNRTTNLRLEDAGEQPLEDLVRRFLRYDRDTGEIFWAKSRPPMKAGERAGQLNVVTGYFQIQIGGKKHAAHRVAWFLEYGQWPVDCVDHIDGDRLNNRISNLRLATVAQNNCNVALGQHNTSGIKGVSFHKASKKWSAFINNKGRQIHLGIYASIEQAAEVVKRKREELHGEFANHG